MGELYDEHEQKRFDNPSHHCCLHRKSMCRQGDESMKIHPKLVGFSKARHIRNFNDFLVHIEQDLNKLGYFNFDAEVVLVGSPRSTFARFFNPSDDAEEALILLLMADDCPVEIYIPISQIGTLPYSIGIELPMPMSGRAEYLPSTFGKPSWHVEPKNKQREKELNHLLPKNQMWQNNYGMGIQYRIKVGQTLEPTPEGKTHWLINSGLESGRPEIKKFLEGISTVKHLLTTWIVAEPRII